MKTPGIPKNEKQRLQSLYLIDLIGKNGLARFDRLTRLAKQTFDVPIAVISLLDKDKQWLLSAVGTDVEETPRTVSFCAHAILEEGVFVIRDTLKDTRFCNNPYVKNQPGVRFYAGCPVRLPDGMIAGIICVVDTSPRFFSSDEVNALLDLASIVEDEFEQISFMMTDEVTGLLNKRGFLKRGEEQILTLSQKNLPFAMITFHLLNFMAINELLGNAEGENLIQKFSTILEQIAGEHCILAHVGNGVFYALLTKTDIFSADTLLLHIQNEVDKYNHKNKKPYSMCYSYGMAESENDPAGTVWDFVMQSNKVNYSEIVRNT